MLSNNSNNDAVLLHKYHLCIPKAWTQLQKYRTNIETFSGHLIEHTQYNNPHKGIRGQHIASYKHVDNHYFICISDLVTCMEYSDSIKRIINDNIWLLCLPDNLVLVLPVISCPSQNTVWTDLNLMNSRVWNTVIFLLPQATVTDQSFILCTTKIQVNSMSKIHGRQENVHTG